ncbi:MAG: hypothetical protein JKY34_03335 [Kordiimonadaceae bacterium]|nr:hypothetical protein [Kordiimonadaceae bacterium]
MNANFTITELNTFEIDFVNGGWTWGGLAGAATAGAVTGALGGAVIGGVGAGPGAAGGALLGSLAYLVNDVVSAAMS